MVNLVSGTQRVGRSDKGKASYGDPTGDVCSYLEPDVQQCFTYRTWEALHDTLILDDPGVVDLNQYLRTKSAYYKRAFDLKPTARPAEHDRPQKVRPEVMETSSANDVREATLPSVPLSTPRFRRS